MISFFFPLVWNAIMFLSSETCETGWENGIRFYSLSWWSKDVYIKSLECGLFEKGRLYFLFKVKGVLRARHSTLYVGSLCSYSGGSRGGSQRTAWTPLWVQIISFSCGNLRTIGQTGRNEPLLENLMSLSKHPGSRWKVSYVWLTIGLTFWSFHQPGYKYPENWDLLYFVNGLHRLMHMN